MANAQYLDVMIYFVVPRHKVSMCVSYVCSASLVVLSLNGLPMTEDERRSVQAAFSTRMFQQNSIEGCLGAIDGIEIEVTNLRGVRDPAQYCNRNGYYSLPAHVVVNRNYPFFRVFEMHRLNTQLARVSRYKTR